MKILSSDTWRLMNARMNYLEDYLQRNEKRLQEERDRAAADWKEITREQGKQKRDELREAFDEFIAKDKENRDEK